MTLIDQSDKMVHHLHWVDGSMLRYKVQYYNNEHIQINLLLSIIPRLEVVELILKKTCKKIQAILTFVNLGLLSKTAFNP